LLTNASSSANDLDDKFRHFKKVIYNVSIDGIGAVGEYQRRGSKWSTVEKHSLELMAHPYISTVINFVLTAINALHVMDFVQWSYDNQFGPKNPQDVVGSFINVSPVFRADHLGVGAMPEDLRVLSLQRLQQGRDSLDGDSIYDTYYRKGQQVRRVLQDKTKSIFEKADFILMPTTPTTAFELNAVKDPIQMYLQDIFTVHANLTGNPAISIPSGIDNEGIPFGIQLMAKPFEESELFQMAATLEQS